MLDNWPRSIHFFAAATPNPQARLSLLSGSARYAEGGGVTLLPRWKSSPWWINHHRVCASYLFNTKFKSLPAKVHHLAELEALISCIPYLCRNAFIVNKMCTSVEISWIIYSKKKKKAGRNKVLILDRINSPCEAAGVFQTASVLHSQFTVTLSIQPGLGF